MESDEPMQPPRSSRDPLIDERLCGFWGGHKKGGGLCTNFVILGIKRCGLHSGKTRLKAKAEGQVVMEVKRWGLDGHTTLRDAGDVLLRLVTQSADRVGLYSRLLGDAYELAERGEEIDPVMRKGGVGVLIGYRYGVDRNGDRFPIEEAVRGLVQLESQERDRCSVFAARAIAAGLAERQVRLAEQQGAMLFAMLTRLAGELDLSPDQESRFTELAPQLLRELTAA